MYMKQFFKIKSIFLFLLFPLFLFGQNSEINEKIAKRNGSTGTQNNRYDYRYRPPIRHQYNPPIIYNRWNSPYIYSPWRYDINPPQINNYYNYGGNYSLNRQKSPSKSFENTLGITFPINKNYETGMGFYYSVGNENRFISTFKFPLTSFYVYENISIYDVKRWNDRYIKTDRAFYEFTVGYGKEINDFVPYLGFGIVNYREYPQYFDEYYILGNDGYYNIMGKSITTPQISIGVLYNKDILNGNLSLSIISVPNLSIGFGFNF